MAFNVQRFESDLEALIGTGIKLEYAMIKEIAGRDALKSTDLNVDELQKFIENLPEFNEAYESWYSEALVVLKQLLPDRVSHFVSFYEKSKIRKEILASNYVIQDYLQGLRVTRGIDTVVVDRSAALPQFRQQLAILKAAKSRFKSSLFEIKQLLQADLFDSEIESARELLKHKFNRAAGAVAGVVLEKHLRQVCEDRNVKISKKNPGISDLNELLKTNSVIEITQWRYISLLGDLRNICDHGKAVEPTDENVRDLIDGVDKVLRTVA